jgi:hypothetical protein
MFSHLRAPLVAGLIASIFLLAACRSASPQTGGSQPPSPRPPAQATAPTSAASAPAGATATIVSQAQPGFSGKVISGTVEYNGAVPPDGSTLYLALVKSPNDQQPRTCIDAERDPINDQGQFYAQVACNPQPGDQLMYVLIIGPPAQRDWHPGVVPLPSDLTNVHLVVSS